MLKTKWRTCLYRFRMVRCVNFLGVQLQFLSLLFAYESFYGCIMHIQILLIFVQIVFAVVKYIKSNYMIYIKSQSVHSLLDLTWLQNCRLLVRRILMLSKKESLLVPSKYLLFVFIFIIFSLNFTCSFQLSCF